MLNPIEYQRLLNQISPIQFYPRPEDIPSEKYTRQVWFPLTENEVPGIMPDRYIVSSFGFVYDNFTGHMFPNERVTKEDYVYSHFRLLDGSKKHISNHIIVMRKFAPFRRVGTTEIDHINGRPWQNWVWNLEYVTHKENLDRAVNIGLYPVAENQQNAIYTNDQIRKVCELIARGLTPQEIVETLKPELPNLDTHIIHDIKTGGQWKSISKEFDFSNMFQKNSSSQFSIEEVELFCSGIEKYKYTKTPRQIAEAVGINMNSLDELEQNRYINCISRLRRKLIFKDICAKYDF